MRQIKNGLLIGLAIAITGCASTGGINNVPVEEAGSRQNTAIGEAAYPQSSSSQSSSSSGSPDNAGSYERSAADYNVAPTKPGNNNAVIALLSSAETQRLSGDYMKSAATLERAIRISPRDPELYYQLAEVRYLQRNFHQTQQLCRKAISLAAGNESVLKKSRELLSRVSNIGAG